MNLHSFTNIYTPYLALHWIQTLGGAGLHPPDQVRAYATCANADVLVSSAHRM